MHNHIKSLRLLVPVILYSVLLAVALNCSRQQKSQIPMIPDDWVLSHETDTSMEWTNPNYESSPDPLHLYRRITVESEKITKEIDGFHFQFNDSIEYRLVKTFHYVDSVANYRLILYFPGSFPPTASRSITAIQADSIFERWGFHKGFQ